MYVYLPPGNCKEIATQNHRLDGHRTWVRMMIWTLQVVTTFAIISIYRCTNGNIALLFVQLEGPYGIGVTASQVDASSAAYLILPTYSIEVAVKIRPDAVLLLGQQSIKYAQQQRHASMV